MFGMQLPVQSQSTIYVQPWEPSPGPAELARVALACEAAGFFYVGVCDHTFIPDRLAGAMGTTWYDTIATLGWLAGITTASASCPTSTWSRCATRCARPRSSPPSTSCPAAGSSAGWVPATSSEEFDLMGPDFDQRGPATDEAIAGLAAGWPTSTRRSRARAGRRPRSGSSPGRSSHPDRRSGWADRRRRRCRRAARFGDGWLPQSLGPNTELLGTLRRLREEFRDGAPLDIGAIADFLYVGTPPAGLELPEGTVAGPAGPGGRLPPPVLRGRRRPGAGAVPVPVGRRALRPDRRVRRRGHPGRPDVRSQPWMVAHDRPDVPAGWWSWPWRWSSLAGLVVADVVTLTKAKPSFENETRAFQNLIKSTTTTTSLRER